MKSILTFIFALFLNHLCFGQEPFVFSTFTEDYIELENGTPIDVFDMTDSTWDDPEFTVPLDNFEIFGTVYDSTTQALFGGVMGFFTPDAGYFDMFGTLAEIIDGSVLPGESASTIMYTSLIGSEYTETIIQYSNVAFSAEVYESGTTHNRMDFQIKLYTPSNVLEIQFGPSTIPDPELVFFGDSGPPILFANRINNNLGIENYGVGLSGNPADPTVVELNSLDVLNPERLDAMPESGRVYRFEPASTGIASNAKPQFSIYPTLTSDYLYIEGSVEPNSTYRIVDLSGKEVKNGTIRSKGRVDVSRLKAGFYLFAVDGLSASAKFVKQ